MESEMSLNDMQQHELLALLAAGAALELPLGTRQQQDLVALAVAAREAGSHLTLTDTAFRQQQDLVAIAMAGRGHLTIKN